MSKTAVHEFQPAVEKLQLAVNPQREHRSPWHGNPKKYAERHDVYYEGTVTIHGKTMPLEIHLISCDGSIGNQRGKYHICATVNKQRKGQRYRRRCPYCSGNRGVSSKETRGLTAVALSEVVVPFLQQQGYEIALDKPYHPGGWFVFQMTAQRKDCPDITPKRPNRRFNIAWMVEIDCPIHGKFIWQEEEPDCD